MTQREGESLPSKLIDIRDIMIVLCSECPPNDPQRAFYVEVTEGYVGGAGGLEQERPVLEIVAAYCLKHVPQDKLNFTPTLITLI